MQRALATDSMLPPSFLNLSTAKSFVPLCAMSDSHLSELLQNCQIDLLFEGQILFETGNYDRQHLYLLHGELTLKFEDDREETLSAGDTFYPVDHVQPRRATAIAAGDCSVLRIDSDYLDKMLCWSQIADYLELEIAAHRDLDEDIGWMMTVLKSNLFYKVPPINVEHIFSRLTSRWVDKGEVILRQGEVGDGCYFIKEGCAEVTRAAAGSSEQQHVADITVGRCFGEDALVNETVRNATVTMSTDGVLMCLTKQDFILLLREPQVEMISADSLSQLQDSDETILIDIRSEPEYDAGHLKNAVNIPLNLLHLKSRLLNPEKKYLVYCDSERRSRAAVHLLEGLSLNAVALRFGLNGLTMDQMKRLQLITHDSLLIAGQLAEGH